MNPRKYNALVIICIVCAAIGVAAFMRMNEMATFYMPLVTVDGCRQLASPSARIVDWADTSRCWMEFYPDNSWNGMRVMVWNISNGAGEYQCDMIRRACGINDGNKSTIEYAYQGGDPGMPIQVHESDFTCKWVDGDDSCECRGEGNYWDNEYGGRK